MAFMKVPDKTDFYLLPSFLNNLFNQSVELLPSVDELFELELAYMEFNSLPKQDLLERLAYFKSIDNEPTKHFLMYNQPINSLINDRSEKTKNYFENGIFSTGYATHGLFPYRGKFHPQLIKALLNIIGIKENEVVLDPLCGSGTTNIEAALMGINSCAIDLSPFCQLMTKIKYDSLTIDVKVLKGISKKSEELFNFFAASNLQKRLSNIEDKEKRKIYNLALLAFLDSLGYSQRVVSSTHKYLFSIVLRRYEETVHNFLSYNSKYLKNIGNLQVLGGVTATMMPLENNSIDGVITSPPYSFAIDYIKNDEAQLSFLGNNINDIRSRMIGLIGKNKEERLENYFKDMNKVCAEIARVLKPNKYLVMIIGSNTNQTGGIRLEQTIIDSCEEYKLQLVKTILKPIKGIRNTMKNEYILFFRKGLKI
jgi:DNA modification methylase